jgi:hypothetical protein
MPSKTKGMSKAELLKTFRIPRSITDDAVHQFLSALNCPRALTVYLLWKSNAPEDHDQLTTLECKPSDYLDAFEFRDSYSATKFLSKANFLNTTFDKKSVALEKFFAFENQCRQTNKRFQNLGLDPSFKGANVWLLNATAQKISRILGTVHAEELMDAANWGPGVTTLLKGSYVSAVNKFHLENGITRELYSLVGPELFPRAYPMWAQHLTHIRGNSGYGEHCYTYVAGNSIVTVPKDSKADRVIAVEPGINLWFQKGCGSMIRSRLRRVLIDLNTQEWNQKYAYHASRDDVLATCDFSSASDSISRSVVEELLPRDWFVLLESCRSKHGIIQGKRLTWEKFSSMGNGFTFELETLIFYSAASAVCEYLGVGQEVCVFGDDVILPSACMSLFASYCAFLGFTVNSKKSFSNSPFRESCGAHYYDGVDVKPIFLKERISSVQAVYKLANSVRLYSHRCNFNYGCDLRFRALWASLVGGIPKPLRLKVSRSLGDTGFIVNFDEACPPKARDQLEGYRVETLTAVGLTDSLDSPAILMVRLRSPSTLEHRNTYVLRGRVRFRFTTVLVPRWYNLGGWY